MTDSLPFHVAIVGGGISGLSSAFYVKRFFAEKKLPVKITLIEKGDSPGGKIQTLRRDGFVIERGPDSFLARKLPIMELTSELKMEDQLVATGPLAKKTYIFLKGRFHRIPNGFTLGIPTEISPLLKTGLLSLKGKARAALDLVIPPKPGTEDESIGEFLERRLGKEVVSNIAEPLLAGIYAGNLYSLSVNATFPQFREMEKRHGSIIRGMMESKKHAASKAGKKPTTQKNVFLTYRNGLSTLVERLMNALSDLDIHLSTEVCNIECSGKRYHIKMRDGRRLEADGVLLAVPPAIAQNMLPQLSIPAIRHISVANVILAFNRENINHPLDGSGFVVPRSENRSITACTWTSTKWPHTAPSDKVLIRSYLGRSGDEGKVNLSDNELIKLVQQDLYDLMGLSATPLFHEVNRLKESMPQYPVGHLENVQKFKAQLASSMPGVLLIGAAFGGIGIPDCIGQGKEAALEISQLALEINRRYCDAINSTTKEGVMR